MDTALLKKIILQCTERRPLNGELDAFAASSGMDVATWCDMFALHIAQEYAAGRLSFRPANIAINHLWEYAGLVDAPFISGFAQEVFFAFDAGEYHHGGDPDEVNPSEKYTRPRVLELLATKASQDAA